MDQIVRDAGMLRLACKDRLQDRRAFELIGIGLVGRRSRRVERQRVVDLRLVVIRIALRQLLHGLGIGQDAGAVIDFVVVGVHDCKRIDVVAFALRLGADALSLGDRGGAFGEIFRGRWTCGFNSKLKRNAPIGDPALGIGLQHILEDFLRRAVPERVLVQHCPVEEFLRFRRARRLEMHLAELAVVHLCEGRLGERKQCGCGESDCCCVRDFDHDVLPVQRLDVFGPRRGFRQLGRSINQPSDTADAVLLGYVSDT